MLYKESLIFSPFKASDHTDLTQECHYAVIFVVLSPYVKYAAISYVSVNQMFSNFEISFVVWYVCKDKTI